MKFVRVNHHNQYFYGALYSDSVQLWTEAPWCGGISTSVYAPIEEVEFVVPIQPGKVLGLAINFPGATGLNKIAKEPLVFFKNHNVIIGPNKAIVSPFKDAYVWGEPELGIVINKRLSRCSLEEALFGVFGYIVCNDVTAKNILGWDDHLPRSKALDTFCSVGRYIDTEFDPKGKEIKGYHNDVLIRRAFADKRLWPEPHLLVWLSSWITLEPGDLILTGGPPRVRDRLYFKHGDTYSCCIDGFEDLVNVYQVN